MKKNIRAKLSLWRVIIVVLCLLSGNISFGQLVIEDGHFLGGSANDYPFKMKSFNGKIYIMGSTRSLDFPVINGVANHGGLDISLSCYDPVTKSYDWSTHIGGVEDELIWDTEGFHIANGKIYFHFVTKSSSLSQQTNPYSGASVGGYNAANACVDIGTGNLDWTTWLGNQRFCCWYASTIHNGKFYVVNVTEDVNWNTTIGPTYNPVTNERELAVSCTDLATGSVDWSRYVGGNFTDLIGSGNNGMTVIGNNLMVNFGTQSPDLPVTDSTSLQGNIPTDFFGQALIALDISTGTTSWFTYLEGMNTMNVSLVNNGTDLLILSSSQNPSFSVTEGLPVSTQGGMVARFYNPVTGAIIKSKVLSSGGGLTFPKSVLVGNDIYFVAGGNNLNFPVTDGSMSTAESLLAAKFDANTADIIWARHLPGGGANVGISQYYINGNYYVSFATNSTDIPVDNGTQNQGGYDVVLQRLDTGDGSTVASSYLGSSNNDLPALYGPNNDVCEAGGLVYTLARVDGADYPVTSASNFFKGSSDIAITGFRFCPDRFVSDKTIVPDTQTICQNGLPSILDAQPTLIPSDSLTTIYRAGVPESQNAIVAKYQWQIAFLANGPWQDIPGARLEDFTPGSVTTDRYYRRISFRRSSCGGAPIDTTNIAIVLVNTNVAPLVDAGGSYQTCAGVPVQLQGSGTGAGSLSYSWDTSPVHSFDTVTVSPNVSTVYNLTVTDANGCQKIDAALVNVVNIDIIDATPCLKNGDSIQIGPVPTVGQSGIIYTWSPSIGMNNTSIINPKVSLPMGTSQQYNLTAIFPITRGGTCTLQDSLVLNSATFPANYPNFAGPDLTICLDNSDTIGLSVPLSDFSMVNIMAVMQSSSLDTLNLVELSDTNFTTGGTTNNGNAEWVQIDLGEVATNITRVDLSAITISNLNGRMLEYSIDGSNWVKIDSISGITNSSLTPFYFEAIDARFLRLLGDSTESVDISEMIVYRGWEYTWAPGGFLAYADMSSRKIFDHGNLIYKPNPNPKEFIVSANKDGCMFSDTMIVNVIEAEAGPDACGPRTIGISKRGDSDMPDLNETFTWTAIAGTPSFIGPTNTAITTVGATACTYEITTTLNGVSCKDTVIVQSCGCGLDIDVEGNNCPINGFQLIGSGGVNGPITYDWSPKSGLSSYNTSTVTLIDNVQRTYTYTVRSLLDTSVYCSKTITTNLPSYILPTFNATSDTLCPGAQEYIGDLTSVAGYTYIWSPTVGLDDPTISNPQLTASVTQDYICQVIVNTTGCRVSDTSRVIVRSVAANAGSDWIICSGSNVKFGVPASSNYVYSWSPVVSTYLNGTDSSSAEPEFFSTGTPSEFIVTATDLSSGCSEMDTVNIILNASPSIVAAPDTFVCLGNDVTIGSEEISHVIYSWSPATGLSNPNIAQPSASPTVTTTYVVSATFPPGTCPDVKDTIVVTVFDPTFILNDTTACPSDGAITLGNGGPVAGVSTYSWTPDILVSSAGTLNPTTLNPPPSIPTDYTLNVTYANGCKASDIQTYTPNSTPLNAGSNRSICLNETVQLGDVGIGGAYSWLPTTNLSNPNISDPTFNPSATGVFTYTVTKTESGCSTTDKVIITVQDFQVPILTSPTICQGASVKIGTASQNGVQYFWSPTNDLSDSAISNPVANPSNNTTYNLTAIGTNGCVANQAITVAVSSFPAPVITMNDITTCDGSLGGLQLNPIITPSGGGYSYHWTLDNSYISNASIVNPVFIPTPGGTSASYTLTIYDSLGCSSSATADIVVEVCPNSLGDRVWNDLDEDGIQDANEVGVDSVTVTLYDDNDNAVGSTVTDAYGNYLFTDLVDGQYSVGFTLLPNYAFTQSNQGPDSTDSDVNPALGITGTYTLAAGKMDLTADAGIYFGTPLPISIRDFRLTKSNCDVSLHWNTVGEENSNRFNILRKSVNQNHFKKIGEVLAHDPLNQWASYDFLDNSLDGTYQYLLEIVDGDGQLSYSNTLGITLNCKKFGLIKIYPNPVSYELSLQTNLPSEDFVKVELFEMSGKKIYEIRRLVESGIKKLTVPMENLASGSYLLTIEGETIEKQEFKVQKK